MAEDEVLLSPNDLRPNQLATIVVNEGNCRGIYQSRIEEVKAPYLLLAAPISRGTIVGLPDGISLQVEVVIRGASFSFQVDVLKRVRLPVPLLIVSLPEKMKKLRRRAWVRVPAVLDLVYVFLKEGETYGDSIRAKTLDISGGGLLLATHQEVRERDILKMSLGLPPGGLLNLTGLVVRVITRPEEKVRPFRAGVEFQDIDNRDRDLIMRYIFDRQRKLIKRGLLQ